MSTDLFIHFQFYPLNLPALSRNLIRPHIGIPCGQTSLFPKDNRPDQGGSDTWHWAQIKHCYFSKRRLINPGAAPL